MNLLRVDSLTKSYKGKKVVDDVSFDIGFGEIFGLLGENGAGKTTTIKMVTTLTRAEGGSAFIKDTDIFRQKTKAKQFMTVVPQDINLDGEISVFDNLLVYAKLRRIKDPKSAVRRVVEEYGLYEKVHEKVQTLSGGQKRRVMIARAMMSEADLIFMDEPTVGLDPGIRREIWQIILSIKKSGRSVLLTTHYTEEAENLCDRVAIMHKGKIISMGAPGELTKKAGAFAMDIYSESSYVTKLFSSEDELNSYALSRNITSFKVRESRLEDVIIKSGEGI